MMVVHSLRDSSTHFTSRHSLVGYRALQELAMECIPQLFLSQHNNNIDLVVVRWAVQRLTSRH